MSVFKVEVDQITYYPDGPASPVVAKKGEVITLTDNLDHLVGTQIHPSQVKKLDKDVLAKAVEEAEKAQAKVLADAAKEAEPKKADK